MAMPHANSGVSSRSLQPIMDHAVMVTAARSGGDREIVDQALLRSLLSRSDYVSSELEAEAGPNHSREVTMIARLREGMITRGGPSASQRDVVSSEISALLRWEDDGGSPDGDDPVGTPAGGNA